MPDVQGKIIDSFQNMLMGTFQSTQEGGSQWLRAGKWLNAVVATRRHWTQIGENIADDNNESEGDGASTTVALDASNDCSEGLDGLAKEIAELGVSVAGETKFRQDEHSNWDAVAANTTSTAAEENDRDVDMIDDENSSNDEHERPRMPIVMIMRREVVDDRRPRSCWVWRRFDHHRQC